MDQPRKGRTWPSNRAAGDGRRPVGATWGMSAETVIPTAHGKGKGEVTSLAPNPHKRTNSRRTAAGWRLPATGRPRRGLTLTESSFPRRDKAALADAAATTTTHPRQNRRKSGSKQGKSRLPAKAAIIAG